LPEWLRRQLGWIGGFVALIAWFAMLYYMFWDVL
jgi:hypothetical protein